MTAIALGISHYVRTAGHLPPILLRNMYTEKDPSNLIDGLVRLQRPALTSFATVGSGPLRGVYRQAGTFNGDYLTVSGTALYRVTTAGVGTFLGPITGTGRVIVAASSTRALIATGGTCYSTDGATVSTIIMPSGESVSSVAYINGYFILTVLGSNRFFWLAPGDANPNALNFASAENAPDNLQICLRLLDELWFLGEASLEIWQSTGNLDAPFERIGGRLFERGCINRDTACVVDNTVFWVGENNIAYRGDTGPIRISDHGIEERLRKTDATKLSAWAFSLDGHSFYVLRIGDEGTFVFDIETQTAWSNWSTFGRDTWRAWAGAQNGSQVIAGDDTTGSLWSLDQRSNKDGTDAMIREVRGGVPLLGRSPERCDNVRLFCATAWGATGVEPTVELNWYDDGGFELTGPWIDMSLGVQGTYWYEVIARQLGAINPPGRLFTFRMSDDAPFRVSFARMNEA